MYDWNLSLEDINQVININYFDEFRMINLVGNIICSNGITSLLCCIL